jgi:hypothetical protein
MNNKPTQEQINEILEFIDSNTDKYEHDKELVKLTWQKAQDEIKLAMLEEIDKILPTCICNDNDFNPFCPNELLDGVWSSALNKQLKQSLGGGK